MEERIVDTGVRPLDFLGPCLSCKSGCTDEIIRLVYKFGQGFFIEDKSVATNAMPETILHGIDGHTDFGSGTLLERTNNFPAFEIRGSVDPDDIVTIAVSRKVRIGDIRVGYTDANTSMTVSSSGRSLNPPGVDAELSKRNRDYWYEYFTGDLRPDATHFAQRWDQEDDEIADEWLEKMHTWVYKRITNTDHVDYYEGCGQTRNYATNDAVVGIWDFNLADSYTTIEELAVYAKQEVIVTFPVCGELEVQRAPSTAGKYYEVENPVGDSAVSGSQSESRKQEVVHFLLKSDCPDPSISTRSEHPHKFGVSYDPFTGINGRHFDNNEEKKNIGMMRKTYLVKVGKVFKTTVVSPGTHPFQRGTSSGGDVYYTIVDPLSTNPASLSGDWLDTRPKPQNRWGGWGMGVPYMGAGSVGSQQATPEVPKPFANYLLQFPFTPMEHKDRITSVPLSGPLGGRGTGNQTPPLPKLGEGPVSGNPTVSSLGGGSFIVFNNAFDDDFSDVQKKNIYDNITDALADFKTTAYRTVSKYTGGTKVHAISDPDGNARDVFSKYLEGRMNVSCDSAVYMAFGTNSYTEATKGSKKFRQSYPDFLNHSRKTKKGAPINIVGRSFHASSRILLGYGNLNRQKSVLNSTIDLNGESSHAELISNANDDVLVLDNDRYFGDNSYVPTTTTVTTSSALGMGTMGGYGGGSSLQFQPQEAFLAAVTFYTAPLSHYSNDNGAEDNDVYELDFTEIHQEVFDVAIAGGVPDGFAVGGFQFGTSISGLEECIKAWTSVDPRYSGNINVNKYADDIWRSNLSAYAYDIKCEAGEDYLNEWIGVSSETRRRGILYTPDGANKTRAGYDGSIVAGDIDKVFESSFIDGSFQNKFVPLPEAIEEGCPTKDPLLNETLLATETGEARIICTDYYPPRFDEGQRVLDDCTVKFDGVGIDYYELVEGLRSVIYDDEGNQCINISHIETFKVRFLNKQIPTERNIFGRIVPMPGQLTDEDFTDPVMHICGQGSFGCDGKWGDIPDKPWGRSTGETYIYNFPTVDSWGMSIPPRPPVLGGPVGYSCSTCWKADCEGGSASLSGSSPLALFLRLQGPKCKGCVPEMSKQDGSGYNRVCRDEPFFPGSTFFIRKCDPIPDDVVNRGELWRPLDKGYLWYTYIGLYPIQGYVYKGKPQPPITPGDPYSTGQRRYGENFDRTPLPKSIYPPWLGSTSRSAFNGARIFYPQPSKTQIKFKLGLNKQSLQIGEIPVKITLGRGEQ
tara:strand:- start:9071 stop:12814 length:3744 start_codon:yes stop_codon:yes gene_type:complete